MLGVYAVPVDPLSAICFLRVYPLPGASSLDVVSQSPSGAWQSCREAYQELWSVAQNLASMLNFILKFWLLQVLKPSGERNPVKLIFYFLCPPVKVSRFPIVFPEFALLRFLPLVQTLYVVYCCYHDRQLQKTSDPSGAESKDGEICHLHMHLII